YGGFVTFVKSNAKALSTACVYQKYLCALPGVRLPTVGVPGAISLCGRSAVPAALISAVNAFCQQKSKNFN
ncbi:MAG: hypothetical protein ACLSG4_17555, partial [Anaerobutyricum sp.]